MKNCKRSIESREAVIARSCGRQPAEQEHNTSKSREAATASEGRVDGVGPVGAAGGVHDRGCSNTTENGVGLLNRLNIQEAVEILIDSFPTATRGKERARRIALLTSFGANAKPYLPRLKATLENELKDDANNKEPEGFTKDVRLSKEEIKKVIQEIENAANPRKMISLEEAKQAGLRGRNDSKTAEEK